MRNNISEDLLQFIEASPSMFHVVANFKKELLAAGFQEIKENDNFQVVANKNYFVTRNDSSIIAFKIPSDTNNLNYKIVASHSDAPSFKIKPNYYLERNGFTCLNVEPYGGVLMATWFDRPLSLAGRVFIKEDDQVKSLLFAYPQPLFTIPSLAIHLNREANTNNALNPQNHLLPILSQNHLGFIEELIAETLKRKLEDIVEFELFLYPVSKGYFWGAENEFISARQLDDLQSAYSSFQAFMKSDNQSEVTVFTCFDNEEVGSQTRQGAASSFLKETLEKISFTLGYVGIKHYQVLARSLLVSADNAHGMHPNYSDKSDPSNQVKLNQGIVIKYNANQSYTTDGLTASIFKSYCELADVPFQNYTNRSDLRGGGTLGSISLSQVSIPSLDIGLAQWAMHSINESAGVLDTNYLYQALLKFYQLPLMIDGTNFKITEKKIGS